MLAAGSWRIYSNTWDEPEHLAAGIELLDRGLYQYDTEHPPLGRILLALPPYLAGARSFGTPPPEGTREGVDILYAGGHYWQMLTLARLGTRTPGSDADFDIHQAVFDVDERAIATGVRLMAATALTAMAGGPVTPESVPGSSDGHERVADAAIA